MLVLRFIFSMSLKFSKWSLLSLFVLIYGIGFAQKDHRTCATNEVHQQYLATNPDAVKKYEEIENRIQQWISNSETNGNKSPAIITIPVVIHVLYNNATQNISNAQLLSQIDVLNEDFRKLNADISLLPSVWQTTAGDAQIEFCLASRDPNGNPTTGITRTATSTSSFSSNNNIKFNATGGKDAWPRDQYLNFWVGNLSGGLLGYAQFPGGAANTDGIVCLYSAVGRVGTLVANYNKGRTATHEIGHWLNLRHIWGDANCGNDFVADTPTQQTANTGCPSFPKVTCSNGPNGDMFMNYMDYTYDACMYMFSNGQNARMLAALNTTRASLLTSQGCAVPTPFDAGISNIISPTGTSCQINYTPQVTLNNYGSTTLTSVIINYQVDGGTIQTQNWTGTLTQGNSANITLPVISVGTGTHSFTAFTSAPNGGTDGNNANNSSTSNFDVLPFVAGQPIPFTEGFETATFPPGGWTLLNPDLNNTWTRLAGPSGFGTSSACTRMDNYSGSTNIAGQFDILQSPPLNFGAALATLQMEFNVAYARYNSTYSDSLFVDASDDCGSTWVRLYGKGSNPGLATAPDQTGSFLPANNEWRKETIGLNAYVGKSGVRFRFISRSGWGNNIYLDDINLYAQSVLPVELLFFAAHPIDNLVELQWATATELNNDFFSVQHSLDGSNFKVIADIKGAGNSTILNTYKTVHKNAIRGINYYKLVQYDFDGTTHESKIVPVKIIGSNTSPIIYPNPTSGNLISIVNLQSATEYTLAIADATGREILTKVIKTESNGMAQIQHSLGDGIYFVKIYSAGIAPQSVKLVVY